MLTHLEKRISYTSSWDYFQFESVKYQRRFWIIISSKAHFLCCFALIGNDESRAENDGWVQDPHTCLSPTKRRVPPHRPHTVLYSIGRIDSLSSACHILLDNNIAKISLDIETRKRPLTLYGPFGAFKGWRAQCVLLLNNGQRLSQPLLDH